MNVPAKADVVSAAIEDVLMRGDLKDLTPKQRTEYANAVCKSLGLNPMTRPFEYLTLNGKLQLYARRDATDQLRKLNGISIEVVSREVDGEMLTVHVRAKDKTGRTDEDFGVVPFKGGASEIAANAMMKAITKAKRRVTLSISGLGFMDESETGFMGDDAPAVEIDPPDVVEPRPLIVPQLPSGGGANWRIFGIELMAILRGCDSKADMFVWLEQNKSNLADMKKQNPTMYENLNKSIEALKAEPT